MKNYKMCIRDRPTGALIAGNNEIVVFELKNNEQASMTLTDKPIFK